MEALIAVAVFAVLASGLILLVADPLVSAAGGADRTRATFLATQGLEAARAIKENRWSDLALGTHGLARDGSANWIFQGMSDQIDGMYTRTVTVSAVERDGANMIVPSGGAIDPRTRKVVVEVSWTSGVIPVPRSVIRSMYLTDWTVYDWKQTTDSDFNAGTHSSTEVFGTGEGASVQLSTAGVKTWTPSEGILVTQTTETDFGAGTFLNTVVNGTGTPATVSGTGSPEWIKIVAGKTLFETTHTDFNDGGFSSTTVSGVGDPSSVVLTSSTIWSNVGNTGNAMFSVSMLSSIDGWAGGASGKLFRWDGTSWSEIQDMGTRDVNGLHCRTASDCWGVAVHEEIYRWNGTSWVLQQDMGNQTLRAVWAVAANDAWAAGAAGRIHRWNGTTWTLNVATGSQTWRGLTCVTASDCWVVGTAGEIRRWNGSAWSLHTDTGSEQWNSVKMLSATDGWIVGNGGVIRRFNGTAWNTVTSPTTQNLFGVDCSSASFCVAVGAGGVAIHWNGTSWSLATTPDAVQQNAVDVLSTTEAYSVGASGSVRRYGDSYAASGTYASNVLDAGESVDWGRIFWNEDAPDDTGITLAVRTGNVAVPDGTWTAWSSELSDPFGSTIPGANSRYIQYRATLATSNQAVTPSLNSVSITYDEPTTATMYDAVLASSSDGWMVGQGGNLLRFDGTSWSTFTPSPTSNTLQGVDFSSTTDAWAVGQSGTIIRWNGTAWNTVTSPTGNYLNSVDVVSASLAFAVGNKGTVLRWNGSSWATMTSPTNKDLWTVSCDSATSCWAVGKNGTIIRYNGTSWSTVASGTTQSLNGVSAVSPTFAVAVGNGGLVLHWNGTAWTPFSSGVNNQLNDVYCHSATECWAVGVRQTFVHWNGSTWSQYVFNNPSNPVMQAVFILHPTEAWATGESGAIFHYLPFIPTPAYFTSSVIDSGSSTAVWNSIAWDASSQPFASLTVAVRTGPTPVPDGSWSAWSSEYSDSGGTTITSPPNRYIQYRATFTNTQPYHTSVLEEVRIIHSAVTAQDLFDTDATSASDVWAVGRAGTIIHYDGAVWSATATPTTDNLNGVSVISANAGFAVGTGGTVIRLTASGWSVQSSPTSNALRSVSAVSLSDAWAVGDSGTIIRWNGTAWATQASPTGNTLRGVSMVDAVTGWAVGDSGTIIRWNGTAWATQTSPTASRLNAVHCLSAAACWAVGDSGTIIRWNGTAWASVTSPVVGRLNAVEARTSSEAWAAGDNGSIIEWDGLAWSVFSSPTSRHLYGIQVATPSDGWIVGRLGVILKDPPVYQPSGVFLSSILDMDAATSTPMMAFWNRTMPALTTLTIAIRTGNVPTPDGSWSAFTPEMTVATGTAITAPAGRYLQYRATLNTADTSVTPMLDDITVTYR